MDLNELGAKLGLEPSEFKDLVELFLTTARIDLEKICEGYRSGDPETVARSAHSLKGASGNLGFSELSMLSRQAESKGAEEDLSALDGIINSIRRQIQEIEECLGNSG